MNAAERGIGLALRAVRSVSGTPVLDRLGMRPQAQELGLGMLGVPEELGGAVSERSTVTTVLAAEALAHGDMGLAVTALAPAGGAPPPPLWGGAAKQSRYLP